MIDGIVMSRASLAGMHTRNRLMKKLAALGVAFAVMLAVPLVAAQNGDKNDKGQNDRQHKDGPAMTPELTALKKEVESWPTDKLRQTIAAEKK